METSHTYEQAERFVRNRWNPTKQADLDRYDISVRVPILLHIVSWMASNRNVTKDDILDLVPEVVPQIRKLTESECAYLIRKWTERSCFRAMVMGQLGVVTNRLGSWEYQVTDYDIQVSYNKLRGKGKDVVKSIDVELV